jgi:hypothetical protein
LWPCAGSLPRRFRIVLKILSHAGLIECRRQGQFVHNRAVPEFVLGQPENAKNKVSELRLPTAAEFFPELVDSKLWSQGQAAAQQSQLDR